MPLVQESYDSLPYIDSEPTPAQRTQAQSLIDAETTPQTSRDESHPLLPPPPPSKLTPLLISEHTRLESKTPISGIDLSRYEALDAPSGPTSKKPDEKSLNAWRQALSSSYTSHEYLRGRQTQLALLNSTGKEDWLAGNEALVEILKRLEEELARTKEAIDGTVVERQRSQREVEGELKVLEETWRKGVGRVLETEVAAEELRTRILEARRSGAV